MSQTMEVFVTGEPLNENRSCLEVGDTEAGRIHEIQIKEEIVVEPELCIMLDVESEMEDERCEGTNIPLPDHMVAEQLRQWKIPAGNTNSSPSMQNVQKIPRRQPTKMHACTTCDKVFNRLNNLKNHEQTHTQTTRCSVCKKDLVTRKKLRNHVRRFHSDQPYSCTLCGKEFKESYELKRHMRIHTGERPYLCEMCEKAFSNAGALKEHKHTHNDVKRFQCDTCSKQFKHKYSLKSHLLTHTGTPISCDICSKLFFKATDLKEHVLSHGALKPYACDKCGTQFIRKDTFYRHAKRKFCMNFSDEKARLVRNEECSWSAVENESTAETIQLLDGLQSK